MTELDALAPSTAGRWAFDNVVVEFDGDLGAGAVEMDRTVSTVTVRHGAASRHIGERLVRTVTDLNLSQREFELVMVGIVRSAVADPVDAWVTYYRNSLDDLMSGRSDFAPVHEHAESLVEGSVLDLGSCFGFFPLRLALNGTDVTATDLSAGTMRLLRTVAPHLGATLDAVTCDAAHVPVADDCVDTVTALHLIEHVDAKVGEAIVAEALRIARRRVVVAVPFESEATACHGHVRTFDEATLTALGASTGAHFETTEYHGGWLVLDKVHQGPQLLR